MVINLRTTSDSDVSTDYRRRTRKESGWASGNGVVRRRRRVRMYEERRGEERRLGFGFGFGFTFTTILLSLYLV